MNSKKPEKTACKLFKSLLLCAVIVMLGALMGNVMKASAPVAEANEKTPDILIVDETSQITSEMTSKMTSKISLVDMGEFEITAYCPCFKCCGKTDGITSTGVTAKAGHTIAVDPSVIPYGTELIIDGIEYRAEDCGGAIKGKRLDIYFDTHAEALEFGRQTADVYLKINA